MNNPLMLAGAVLAASIASADGTFIKHAPMTESSVASQPVSIPYVYADLGQDNRSSKEGELPDDYWMYNKVDPEAGRRIKSSKGKHPSNLTPKKKKKRKK